MEECKVNGEGNLIVVLARNSVIFEKGFFLELGYGLNSMAIEEIVEEDGVVTGQIEMGNFAHFV